MSSLTLPKHTVAHANRLRTTLWRTSERGDRKKKKNRARTTSATHAFVIRGTCLPMNLKRVRERTENVLLSGPVFNQNPHCTSNSEFAVQSLHVAIATIQRFGTNRSRLRSRQEHQVHYFFPIKLRIVVSRSTDNKDGDIIINLIVLLTSATDELFIFSQRYNITRLGYSCKGSSMQDSRTVTPVQLCMFFNFYVYFVRPLEINHSDLWYCLTADRK